MWREPVGLLIMEMNTAPLPSSGWLAFSCPCSGRFPSGTPVGEGGCGCHVQERFRVFGFPVDPVNQSLKGLGKGSGNEFTVGCSKQCSLYDRFSYVHLSKYDILCCTKWISVPIYPRLQ